MRDESKLYDIIFSLVLTISEKPSRDYFLDKDNQDKAMWVVNQLNACGYPTMPIGSCWGRPCTQQEHDEYYNKRRVNGYELWDHDSPERKAYVEGFGRDDEKD